MISRKLGFSKVLRFALDTNNSGSNTCSFTTTKTLSSARTHTFSVWIKIQTSVPSIDRRIIGNGTGGFGAGDYFTIGYTDTTIVVKARVSTTTRGHSFTVTDMNDGKWHHVFIQIDTTQATDTNRIKVWVDNSAKTPASMGSGYFTLNQDLPVIGWEAFVFNDTGGTSRFSDLHVAQLCLVDGSIVAVTSFITGKRPLRFAGPYGTEGFNLEFNDGANPGDDAAGNGDWTEDSPVGALIQITNTPG